MALKSDELEAEFGRVLKATNSREFTFGEYHPSDISGCPLKSAIDKMTEGTTELNAYLFQGSAVHYYLQEQRSPSGYDGIVTEALHNLGCHPLDTNYEVSGSKEIEDGVEITGTCDVFASDGEDNIILDLKYSSVTPSTHHGRLLKYMSQVNCYSHIFDADQQGLVLINHKAGKYNSDIDSIPEGITAVLGEPSDENWSLVKKKAVAIHNVLETFGYERGERWTADMLEDADLDFWQELFKFLDAGDCPSYDKECNYCDYEDFCPVVNGDVGSGVMSFKGGL